MFQKADTPWWKGTLAQATVHAGPPPSPPANLGTAPARDATRAGGRVHLPAGRAAGPGGAGPTRQRHGALAAVSADQLHRAPGPRQPLPQHESERAGSTTPSETRKHISGKRTLVQINYDLCSETITRHFL